MSVSLLRGETAVHCAEAAGYEPFWAVTNMPAPSTEAHVDARPARMTNRNLETSGAIDR